MLELSIGGHVVLVSKFTERTNNVVRDSETITNTNTLEVEFIVLLKSLSSDGRNVLSCIGFTEKEERRILRGNTNLIETTIAIEIELVEGIKELFSNLILILGNFRRRISIGDTSTNGLINKNNVVIVSPRVGVGGEVEGTVRSLVNIERT